MVRLPLDKNWMKSLTISEMKCGGYILKDFLNSFPDDEMSDDVKACRDVRNAWNSKDKYLPVRNFRSLAVCVDRLIGFSEHYGKYEILMGAELRGRKLHDENSSQGISAAILTSYDRVIEDRIMGKSKFEDLRYHIRNAILAKAYYENPYDITTDSIYHEDVTIKKQFEYFIAKLCGKNIKLKIDSAEDIPLAYMMNEIELDEAEKRFPSLRNHETDRIEELEYQKRRLWRKPSVVCTDHRIVMACAMVNHLIPQEDGLKVIKYEDAVNKSFPKFWDYLGEMVKIYGTE